MFSFVRVLGTSSLRYCTRFNGKSNKTVTTLLSSNKIGFDYGLSVSFLVPDHVRFRSDQIYKKAEPGEGVLVSVNHLDNSMVKEVISTGCDYHESSCLRLCSIHYFEKECNYNLSNQLGLGGNDTCSKVCVESIRKNFNEVVECRKACLVECDSVSYELAEEKRIILDGSSNIFSKIVTKENLDRKTLFQNYTLNDIGQKFVSFKVYYDRLISFTEISELPKTTFTELISELGGTIGNCMKKHWSILSN